MIHVILLYFDDNKPFKMSRQVYLPEIKSDMIPNTQDQGGNNLYYYDKV